MIRIQHESTFFGANPFSANPVVVVSITLTTETPEFITVLEQGCLRLHENFPEWVHAEPLLKQPVAKIVGQTAVEWALGALNEVRGFLHDAGTKATPEGARLWLEFHHLGVSLSALKLALKLLVHAGQSTTYDRHDVSSALDSLWKLCRRNHPDYQTRILMQAARLHDIPVLQFISGAKYWQYGWGCRSRIFFESMSNADGLLGYELQHSKILGKAVFSSLGFSTPEYNLVNQLSELTKAAEVIGWPCVVKPLFSGGGKGVTAGIKNIFDLEAAFALARHFTNGAVMVEKFIPGDDHRLMVIDGKLFAAIRREPSTVTGDGRSSIMQLLKKVNHCRSSNMLKSRYLRPIASDEILEQHLACQHVNLDSVLESGRRITLRSNANLSTGGVCIDVTMRVHPHVRQMAETVAQTMGLATVGIDYITTDIEQSCESGGALIEANTTPGLDAMIAAGQDPLIVGYAVLGAIPARIPVKMVITRPTDLMHAKMWLKNQTCTEGFGWTCDGETAIDGMPLRVTGSQPWATVHALLHHKIIHQLCIVCTAEDIVRHGMPLDKANHIVLCEEKSGLPPEWLQVLIDHSDTMERFSGWNEFKRMQS